MYWVKKTSKIQKISNLENYQIIWVLKLKKNVNWSIQIFLKNGISS